MATFREEIEAQEIEDFLAGLKGSKQDEHLDLEASGNLPCAPRCIRSAELLLEKLLNSDEEVMPVHEPNAARAILAEFVEYRRKEILTCFPGCCTNGPNY